jgi:nucleotide-binding universal stress UspA family protein
MMKKILVPVDFSTNANNALKYADRLASDINAELIVMNIYDGGISNYEAGWPIEELFENVKSLLEDKTNAVIKENCNSLNISTIVKEGNVKDTILDSITELDADFVVMGTHGASLIKKVLFGSNTAHIITHSEAPVLAIPEDYDYMPIQRIVYASDFNNLEAELEMLSRAAELLNTSIETLHLRYETETTTGIEDTFNQIVAENNFKNVTLVQQVFYLENTLANAIKEYAESQKNIVLAMFTQDRNIFESLLLGSKTEYLTYKLHIPLLAMNKENI